MIFYFDVHFASVSMPLHTEESINWLCWPIACDSLAPKRSLTFFRSVDFQTKNRRRKKKICFSLRCSISSFYWKWWASRYVLRKRYEGTGCMRKTANREFLLRKWMCERARASVSSRWSLFICFQMNWEDVTFSQQSNASECTQSIQKIRKTSRSRARRILSQIVACWSGIYANKIRII